MPEAPSPKVQLHDTGDTPPDVIALKLIETPASFGFGLALAITVSLGLTVTVMLPLEATPRISVAVTVAVNAPAVI
jgi:hypothetical protein